MKNQYLHREVLYKKASPFSYVDSQIAIMQDLLKHKSKIHAKYVHFVTYEIYDMAQDCILIIAHWWESDNPNKSAVFLPMMGEKVISAHTIDMEDG